MKKPVITIITAVLIVAVSLGLFYNLASDSPQPYDIKTKVFNDLKKLKDQKAEEVFTYFNAIHQKTEQVVNDELLIAAFKKLLAPPHFNLKLSEQLDMHYALNYSDFYDIIFIRKDGYIFHTIKHESDYHQNLFEGKLARTKLSQGIKNNPHNHFIDYENFYPSNEPAAFFATEIELNNTHAGWIVLQCPINRINRILNSDISLGTTCEVYLVNQQHLMLSDSRFMQDSTILKQPIDTVSVKKALEEEKTGEQITTDYRGIRVFSSYSRFNIFETTWIIIAELDESEALTQYYRHFKDQLHEQLWKWYADHTRSLVTYERPEKRVHVDMNEFGRVTGEIIATYGVAYCTAISIEYPERFAYLAHLAPTDRIYEQAGTAKNLLSYKSDLLGNLIKRLQYYDIRPCEQHNLHFLLAAPHTNSFAAAIDVILEQGLFLSNISIHYNPKARSVNLYIDAAHKTTTLEWNTAAGSFFENADKKMTLEAALRSVIDYDA